MSNLNFNDFIENEYIEQEIRLPDNTIREILINHNTNYDINYTNYDNINITPIDYDPELQLAINESIKEQEEYEKKQLEYLAKTRLRVQTFKDILFKIKKISMIDQKILNFYNIIFLFFK